MLAPENPPIGARIGAALILFAGGGIAVAAVPASPPALSYFASYATGLIIGAAILLILSRRRNG